MKLLINYIFVTLLLFSLQGNTAERISKSERASISTLAILSMYETKCADLTDFGYEVFDKVVNDQESKGRNIWLTDAWQEGSNRTSKVFISNSKAVACRELRVIIKKMPLFNQMIN